ncbi:DEP domain-containing protein 1B-like isoform X2 [Gigantopelta aegis]|uniref:DEP domain-containing protein 1B-like isoform X2 n=1 Tax=Gigantopelta aegis TaxID=1735272 RepID=UPI001B889923|nr:DEP domain-containing protein 1B-like isoform X2 [Gigantopelta aegis]
MEPESRIDTDVHFGPYRATKLWNDVVATFRMGMPQGRHKRYMRTHENCFVATQAVDWLHRYLKGNPNFGPEVNRGQTIQLLKKFHKSGVFEDVSHSKHSHLEFSDNGRLYRFRDTSPARPLRSALAPRPTANYVNTRAGEKTRTKAGSKLNATMPASGVRECRLVARVLSVNDVQDVWKNITLHRLQKCLGSNVSTSLSEILDSGLVNGQNILHNSLYVNKSGVVTNIKPQDQLPHWAMSAMKCLARWPEQVDNSLPSYPGFERDVFGVVKDYFHSLPEPLMTYDMYEVITNVYVLAKNHLPRHSSPNIGSTRTTSGIWSCSSLENLLMEIVRNNGTERSTSRQYSSHLSGCSGSFNLSHFYPVAESTASEGWRRSNSMADLAVTRYETAFGPENRIITRVFYSNGVSTDYGHCSFGVDEEFMPLETHFDLTPNGVVNNSSAKNNQINFTRAKSFEKIDSIDTSSKNGREQLHMGSRSSAPSGYPDTPVSSHNYNSRGESRHSLSFKSCRSVEKSCSSQHSASYQPILDGSKLRTSRFSLSVSSPNLPRSSGPASRTHSSIHNGTSKVSASMIDLTPQKSRRDGPSTHHWRKSACLDLQALQSEDKTRTALSLVCLLLPPANRRKLQLLLKLMYKMSNNPKLRLNEEQSTRDLVISTFYRCILSSHEEADLDEMLVLQIVGFLLDNHAEVLGVPTVLKTHVEERLKDMQKPQIVYSPGDPSQLHYCKQVTTREYNRQKVCNSQGALRDLLDEIINDEAMSNKNKRKRLKQFQKTYPELYAKRFPTQESEDEVMPAKPKIKPPLLAKPLMKLRGLRF